MFIQRILTTAVLAELLLFLMVANCAPSRPREDAGRVPGNPASSYLPSVVSSSSVGSSSSSNSNNIKNGHKRKTGSSSSSSAVIDSSLILTKDHHPPNEIAGFRRVYRWSTGCSSVRPDGGLLRFLHNGVDARGDSTDPDTDIELSSVGSDGKVYIISKTRKHYLCFNKKGQLVTKKRPGADKTLCQFYETLWRGNRRFVSVYRRQQQQQQEPQQQQRQQPIVPWPVPLPGSWNDGSPSSLLSPVAPAFQLDNSQEHAEDWHVGFDRTGKPLKGSAWRASNYRSCFDLVEHVDHVHSSTVRSWPFGDNQMSKIFQSENSVPERSETINSPGKSGKGSTGQSKNNNNNKNHHKSQAKSKVNAAAAGGGGGGGTSENVKSVSKNNLGRAPVNHKNVATSSSNSNSWKSSGSGANNKRNNKINNNQHHSSGTSSSGSRKDREGVFSEGQGRARKSKVNKVATAETELLAPVEFWKTKFDEKYNNNNEEAVVAPASANVDFDSYLAETEQLLAHPEQVIGHSEDSSTSSPAQRSAFIHLESGGWEEVVYNKSGDSTPAASVLHQKEDLVIIDDQWQTQMKWSDNAGQE